MAFISVIICSFNRSALLSRAIDSVLSQSHNFLEIIVVDDHSNEKEYKIIELFDCWKRENCHLIRLDRNSGVAKATNIGFSQSRGDYIALLGDDDYWSDTQKIEKQLDIFESEGIHRLGVVGTWWEELGSNGCLLKDPAEPLDWVSKLLSGGGIICGSTPLISRLAWDAAGGMDEKMPRGTDSDLFRRIVLNNFPAKILPEVTTVVDVGHAGVRMTPTVGIASYTKVRDANLRILYKYFFQFVRRSLILVQRIKVIFWAQYNISKGLYAARTKDTGK